MLLGFAYICVQVNNHSATILPAALEKQIIVLEGTIVSAVEQTVVPARYKSGNEIKSKFLFKVKSTSMAWPNPGTIQLSWSNAPRKVQAGDVWRLPVKLMRPRNYYNPGSFDLEKFSFQNRIGATGYVFPKGKKQLIYVSNVIQFNNKIRQDLLNTISSKLSHHEYSGVMTALTLGSKFLIPQPQMEVLQNTGTAHLMAISGMHIGLIAALVFGMVRLLWLFAPRSLLHIPVPWVAASAALCFSITYALLAGFAISTQRAVIMLGFVFFGLFYKRKVSATQRYFLALTAVVLWDPFVVLSAGFWLSFIAVGALIYVFVGREIEPSRLKRILLPQLIITIILLPISLLYFGKISYLSPLANLIAIPLVTLFIVPLSLLAIAVLPLNFALSDGVFYITNYSLELIFKILKFLSTLQPFIWQPPNQFTVLIIVIGSISAFWLLMPRGLPRRYLALLGFVPLFFTAQQQLNFGEADFTLLDVGQGLAAVIRTQHHTLVYDTGAKLSADFDMGSKVLVPFLRQSGVNKIDVLLISHGDNDHIGGAASLLQQIKTTTLLSNDQNALQEYNPQACYGPQQWEWDGVQFTILHPSTDKLYKKRNDQSCVLLVQAGDHKVLLTGDIETKAERDLIAMYGNQLQADLLLVPHHGSKSSSSLEFLQTVQPQYALVPVGYKNQYGHPKSIIMERYQDLGINILQTQQSGAISVRFGGDTKAIKPQEYRAGLYKIWLAKSG